MKIIATHKLFLNTIISGILILEMAGMLWSASGPGTDTANYLRVDVGGRSAGMGGTQYGSENTAFGSFYNPALIAGIQQKEIGFMHNEFISDLRQDYLTFVQPTLTRGNIGLALNYFSYGQIAGYDQTGTPTGNLSANDMALSLGWARMWDWYVAGKTLDDFSVGANLKILRRNLADQSALGFAVDAGLSYPLQAKYLRGMRFGLAVQNLGPGIKFYSDTSPLPRIVRAGVVRNFWGNAFAVNLDLLHEDTALYPEAGVEYHFLKIASIRAGYKGNKYLDNKLTYGIGFENPLFRVDYAFVPFSELGDTHRISVSFMFGKNYKRPKADDMLRERLMEAQTLYAQGMLVDAYMKAIQIQRVAPWLDDNNKLVTQIQRDFKELEESDRREKLNMQVAAILSRGEQFFTEGNLINARLEFQAVLGLEPGNKVAQGYIRQIEAQFKSFVESFYRTGMVAFAAENYEKAKEEFEKVLIIDPDHAEAKQQLARTLKILERREKEIAEQVRQDTIAKTYREAVKTYQAEKYEEAIKLFRSVLELDPNNEELKRYIQSSKENLFRRYAQKGREFADKGNWEESIKILRIALDYNPLDNSLRQFLADVERKWDLQKKVVSQNLYRQGLEAFLAGDKRKAREIWKRAVTLDPENEEAKRGLVRVGSE